jgi:hypothetical protein
MLAPPIACVIVNEKALARGLRSSMRPQVLPDVQKKRSLWCGRQLSGGRFNGPLGHPGNTDLKRHEGDNRIMHWYWINPRKIPETYTFAYSSHAASDR